MFREYNFKDFIYEALDNLKFVKPTEVQEEVIPRILNKENVIVKSKTGTGKTHAFLLPLINNIEDVKEVQCVIIVPTRELAYQTYDEVTKITKYSPTFIDVRTYVGGTDRKDEIDRLSHSQPQIVIGTIGKIKDLAIDLNLLKIHTAKVVVVDEADMVFETDELVELDQIFSRFRDNFQALAFSATIPNELIVFLNKYLTKFSTINLTDKKISHEKITHVFIPTKNKDKFAMLVELLNLITPYLALIFANTKTMVEEVAKYLGEHGFEVGVLTGDLLPRERKQVLKRIKNGDFQYVVASDIAARGIDIPGVSHVINFELPNDLDFFIHRSGRTGRFDLTGTSISFYDYEDDVYLNKLEAKGLKCTYMEIKNGELVDLKERNQKKNKSKEKYSIIEQVHRSIPMPKKVKPGYRKKRKEQIEKILRKMKRQKIQEIYRRKAKKNENR